MHLQMAKGMTEVAKQTGLGREKALTRRYGLTSAVSDYLIRTSSGRGEDHVYQRECVILQ